MTEPAPKAEGPPPVGWDPVQWLAYCMIEEGSPQRTVAHAVDRSTGTLSGWVKKWRAAYGEDLFRAQRKANERRSQKAKPLHEREEVHALAKLWKDARPAGARVSAELGMKATSLIDGWLNHLAENPDRVNELEPKDVRFLSKIASDAWANADRLADIPHPDRGTKLVNKGTLIAGGQVQQISADLRSLDAASKADNVVELRDKVLLMKDSLARRRDIIETGVAEENDTA